MYTLSPIRSILLLHRFHYRDLHTGGLFHPKLVLLASDSQTTTINDDPNQAKKHKSMVFLKTHKSGSTTLIAPFQKFAYLNNLLVMVPNVDTAMFNWPLEFKPNRDNVPNPPNKTFDMLVNHIIFNKTSIAPLMKPDTKYFTVLRDPLAHLKSSFGYFGLNVDGHLGEGKAGFEKFLESPAKHDHMPDWIKPVLPFANNRINSLTRNVQSADLGLMYKDFFNKTRVDDFIAKTLYDFDLILILERIHESLVVFRRLMGWDMADIVFMAKNWRPAGFTVRDMSPEAQKRGRAWCDIDARLYTAANQKLTRMASQEEGLQEEITVFKQVQQTVTQFCWNPERTINSTIIIPQSTWNRQFVVDNKYCVLLLLDERDLTLIFKCQQKPEHRECPQPSHRRLDAHQNMLEGKEKFHFIPFATQQPKKKNSAHT